MKRTAPIGVMHLCWDEDHLNLPSRNVHCVVPSVVVSKERSLSLCCIGQIARGSPGIHNISVRSPVLVCALDIARYYFDDWIALGKKGQTIATGAELESLTRRILQPLKRGRKKRVPAPGQEELFA